jgi:hypothetical protein
VLHDMSKELMRVSTRHWYDNEFLTPGWFVVIGVIIAFYVVWFILLDKSRAAELLLLGALASVAYSFNNLVISNYLGLVEYEIRIAPIVPNLLFSSVTLCPIILMLAQQYAPSWRGYFLWSAAGMAFLSLGIFSVYTWLGILQWYDGYNVFWHFLELFAAAIGTRVIFLWIVHTNKGHAAKRKAA